MKILFSILSISLLFLNFKEAHKTAKPRLTEIEHKSKSVRKIIPDYFEIHSQQFEEFKSGNAAKWFISANGNSRLYLIPYTDYSVTTAILTNRDTLSIEVKELLKSEGIQFNNKDEAIEIANIESKKGIKLGISSNYVSDILGKPDSRQIENKLAKLHWKFKMLEDKNHNGNLKPFILKDLGFEAEMLFENDKLVTLIYRYEVP